MAKFAAWCSGFAGLVLLAGPAPAHPHLASSSPAEGAKSAHVATIRLVFSEAVEANLSTVRLEAGQEDRSFVTPSAQADPADPKALVVTPFEPLPQGRYVVRWKAVGADGHPAKGSFSFVVSK